MSKVQEIRISEEMQRSYLDYAMSVIVARALPDVRDGLKPVHRRILYAMHKLGLSYSGRFSKSAKVVGEVLGKYHPHGDAPVYDALVRMAQNFSMRYPLVAGQGNFGSIDGDPPAAMRYTEVKLTKIAEEMLRDIERQTVPFSENFDNTLKEPVYLPAKLPNLLLMGAEGIAVGMATKIPPHNLNEVVDALCLMIDQAKKIETDEESETAAVEKEPDKEEEGVVQRALTEGKIAEVKKSGNSELETTQPAIAFDVTLDDLLKHIKGPDFPTAASIYGWSDVKQAYATGKGKILIRAKIDDEDLGRGKKAIIVQELPFQVNKAKLVEKIATLVKNKRVSGISDLRDESDKDGIRIVIELKKDAVFQKMVNNLFQHTDLQTTFPLNMVVLVDGTPLTLSLRSILEHYLRHRIEVVTKRSQFELEQAKHRAHILKGLLIALDNIDQVVETIKKSKSEPEAKTKLMKKFALTDIQAQAILDMQLKKLTGLERQKIEDELSMLSETIKYLEALLRDIFKILKVIREELIYLKDKFGDQRRTRVFKHKPGQFSQEQLIINQEVIVILTREGYIKQVPRETFKVQHRGGKGVSAFKVKEEDNVFYITSAMTHDAILFFTNKGKVYRTRIWEIPKATRTSKGKAVINLIGITPDEKITSVLTYSGNEEKTKKNQYVLMTTKKGTIKKTRLSNFDNIRSSGIIAVKLDKNDELLGAELTDGKKRVILATRLGKAIVFDEDNVRPMGRSTRGVKAIDLGKGDTVASMDIFEQKEKQKQIVVICEKGIGKKTPLRLFPTQRRAGKGVKIATLDEKTGSIAFSSTIEKSDKTLIITSKSGQVVKIPIGSIPSLSRPAKGVILMRFSDKKGKVASATFI